VEPRTWGVRSSYMQIKRLRSPVLRSAMGGKRTPLTT
jgi:hypothetical protein